MTLQVEGYVAEGMEKVRDVFVRNFIEEGEVGAAIAIYRGAEKLVDLWGGVADSNTGARWEENTICGFYSTGKPLVALLLLRELDERQINLETAVAEVWPEFAAQGKAGISFRTLLSHRAGLPAIRARLPEGAMLDWDLMVKHLAAESPWFEPGSRHVYHTNTYGFLVGEPLRRLTGCKPGEYLKTAVSEPLGEDVYFGVGKQDLNRCATLYWDGGGVPDSRILDLPMTEEERMLRHGTFNPSGLSSLGVLNSSPWRMAQVPSTNGHGTARSIARLYGILANGGAADGFELLSARMLEQATRIQSQGYCPALDRQVDFGLGFQLTRPDRPLGQGPGTFGHFGTGGSLGFADPATNIGFGYVMNHIKPRWQNSRNRALVDSIYACI